MRFGLAGALPYLGTSGFTLYLANQAGQAASGATSSIDPGLAMSLLDQNLTLQVTYGAVMLSFLGALHWGMEFAEYGGSKGSKRLMLGVAPIIVGWGSLAFDPSMALVTQWAGFTGLWYADMKATSAGWSKSSFSRQFHNNIDSLQHHSGTPNIDSTYPSWSVHALSVPWLELPTWDLHNLIPLLFVNYINFENSVPNER